VRIINQGILNECLTLYRIPEITIQNVSIGTIKLLEIFITPQITTGESGRSFYAMVLIETCLNYGKNFHTGWMLP